jgi:dihydrofolate synthase/folylpolyglutamate synthase
VSARLTRFNRLADWLAWQETAHPVKIDLSLGRVRHVLAALAPPLAGVPVSTVAGTNGKGSTVAFLDAIYRAAGYRTGVYTSPHLLRYNERVRVAGHDASDDALCAAFERIDAARGEVSLSYFEWGTLAALDVFAAAGCEVLILEVGLGGRLDAVNAVDADVAILTSVDLDHQQFLGNTRDAIGAEKAAIARPGRPLIVTDCDPPASVVDHAARCGARLWRYGFDYEATASGDDAWTWTCGDARLAMPRPGLVGAVQLRNAASAVLAARLLAPRLPVDDTALACGVAGARIGARFERRGRDPEWVLDVAHNPEAARNLAENLRAHPLPGRTFAVLGMLADKDAAGVLAPLRHLIDAWHVASLDGPRGASAQQLATHLTALGVAALRVHGDVGTACRAAQQAAGSGGRVLVFGSFHTVEQALRSPLLPPEATVATL